MTEEELKDLKHQLNLKFGFYEKTDIDPGELDHYNKIYEETGSVRGVQAELDSYRRKFDHLSGVKDYVNYFETEIVKDYLILDEDGNNPDYIEGGEEFAAVYTTLKDYKDAVMLPDKDVKEAQDKLPELEKKEADAKKAFEEKKALHEQKLEDLKKAKEEADKKAAETEKTRLKDLKREFDNTLKALEKENKDFLNLSSNLDEIMKKNNELLAAQTANKGNKEDLAEQLKLTKEMMATVQQAMLDSSERLKNYSQNKEKLDAILKDTSVLDAAKAENQKNYETKAAKLAPEEEEITTLEKKAGEAANETEDARKVIADAPERKKAAERELEDYKKTVSDCVKKHIDKELREITPKMNSCERYLNVAYKLENTTPDKTPYTVTEGLALVKRAYSAYHNNHNWFTRMFKNWSNTSAGKDYAQYKEVRDLYMRHSGVPQNEIDDYLDHGRYTGSLLEAENKVLAGPELPDILKNAGKEENRVPQPVDEKELNGGAEEKDNERNMDAPAPEKAEEKTEVVNKQ